MSATPDPHRTPTPGRRRLLLTLVALAMVGGTLWFALDRMAQYLVVEMDRSVLDTPRRDDGAHKRP